jgi:DNA-binding Lrp family transcriptional regulator
MAFPSTKRCSRFTRASHPPRIELTARDLEILRRVHQHRFLDSEQIGRIVGGSRQSVLRRLQLLFHHGYLNRPRAQIEYFHQDGSRPLVYGIGRKPTGIPVSDDSSVGPRSRGSPGRLYLQHTLLIAEAMVALELSCRARTDVRFIPEAELRMEGGFRWSVALHHDGATRRVGLIPDAVFALEHSDGTRAYYFLEADRGTMPVRRRTLNQSSFFRKLLAYAATWTQDLHRRKFGFHRFRVVTITRSTRRVDNLVAAAADLPTGQGLFLFGDSSALSGADPLSRGWSTARRGRSTPLFEID